MRRRRGRGAVRTQADRQREREREAETHTYAGLREGVLEQGQTPSSSLAVLEGTLHTATSACHRAAPSAVPVCRRQVGLSPCRVRAVCPTGGERRRARRASSSSRWTRAAGCTPTTRRCTRHQTASGYSSARPVRLSSSPLPPAPCFACRTRGRSSHVRPRFVALSGEHGGYDQQLPCGRGAAAGQPSARSVLIAVLR